MDKTYAFASDLREWGEPRLRILSYNLRKFALIRC